jgi:hypothetical protein
MSQYFIGIACFTFGTAFVQALVAELPFVRLEKILLGGAARPKKPDQKPKSELPNGHVNIATDVPLKEKEKVEATTIISATKADEAREQEKPEIGSNISETKTETASDTSATTTTAEIEDIAEKADSVTEISDGKITTEEITKVVEPQVSITST